MLLENIPILKLNQACFNLWCSKKLKWKSHRELSACWSAFDLFNSASYYFRSPLSQETVSEVWIIFIKQNLEYSLIHFSRCCIHNDKYPHRIPEYFSLLVQAFQTFHFHLTFRLLNHWDILERLKTPQKTRFHTFTHFTPTAVTALPDPSTHHEHSPWDTFLTSPEQTMFTSERIFDTAIKHFCYLMLCGENDGEQFIF